MFETVLQLNITPKLAFVDYFTILLDWTQTIIELCKKS